MATPFNTALNMAAGPMRQSTLQYKPATFQPAPPPQTVSSSTFKPKKPAGQNPQVQQQQKNINKNNKVQKTYGV